MPLKILVTAKRVEDPESKIKVKPDGSGIVTDGVNYKMNPFDEIAVEEALRLKEKHGGEVIVASIGPDKNVTELRAALAMGADRGILVKHEGPLDPVVVSALLAKVVEQEKPDLVILGKQSIDDDQNQAGQYLAARLGRPQATFASKKESLESEAEAKKEPGVKLSADGKSVQVVREIDGGIETLELKLPAVVTTAGSLTSSVSMPPSISRTTRRLVPSAPSSSPGSFFASASDSSDAFFDAKVACGRPRRAARYCPAWFWSSSIDCLPRMTRSGFSASQILARSAETTTGSSAPSCFTRTPRSAPMARAARSSVTDLSPPIEATTTSPPCLSLSRSPSSTAISSNGFIL